MRAAPSVGPRVDSYDNALAVTTYGAYKTHLLQRRGPWRTVDEVELATLGWVDWYNQRRRAEVFGAVMRRPLRAYDASVSEWGRIRSVTEAWRVALRKGRFEDH